MKAQRRDARLHYIVFYVSWNKKNVFNENVYDKLNSPRSAPAGVCVTPKMQ